MPQIQQADLFLSQIFWLFLTFLVVYMFVATFFAPRISKVVAIRDDSVKQNLAEAESLLAQQKHIKTEMDAILATARQEGAEIRHLAQEKAESYTIDKIRQFERDLTKKVAKEDERLARLKHQLEKDVHAHSDKLAKEIKKVILPVTLESRV